jgi:GNAT superfamily N-acetyltransferase
MAYLTTALNSSHKKQNFTCGNALLDRYLHKQAKQDVKRKLSACFILADENGEVKGYYTLSNAGIPGTDLPQEWQKKLPPSYHSLPVTLLGRLAVSENAQGQGIGELLLIDALKRSYYVSEEVGSMAVIVDPIDESATRFYQKYGFILLPDSGKMFLPMKTISQLF